MAGRFARWFAHRSTGAGQVKRRFDAAAMARIREAIVAAESGHAGEVRFAVEASLPGPKLRQHPDARSRALEVFALLRVWDTEANTGVLLYLLWADHAIEIVADRGIAARVPQTAWDGVCAAIVEGLSAGRPVDAVVEGICRIGGLLRAALPPDTSTPDELPDEPALL